MLIAQLLLQAVLCTGPQLTWESHTNFNDVAGLCADTSGMVICGATSGGLFTFSAADTVLLRHITNTDGLPYIEAVMAVTGTDNRAWIGTRGGGVCAVNLRTGAVGTAVDRNDGLISDTVPALAYWHPAAGSDRVIAGMSGGLCLIDPASGAIVRNFYPQQGYPLGNAVQAVAVRRDTLWVGTDQSVVYAPLAAIINPALWSTAITVNAISLFAADTMIIAGTPAGAVRKGSGPVWQSFTGIGAAVRSVTMLGDSIFFATSNGIKYFHAGNIYDLSSGLPSTNATSLTADRQNRLWAGTAGGLALLQGTSWRPFRFNGLGGNNCKAVAADASGRPWVSHPLTGVSRRLNGAWQTFNQGTTSCQINNVTAIGCDPGGDVWMGTMGYGVSRFTGTGYWIQYGAPPLPLNYVASILPAGSNGVYFAQWAVSENDLISLWDRTDTTWHIIRGPDYQFRPLCLAYSSDGSLWIGVYGKIFKGVYRLEPSGAWTNWSSANSGLPGDKVNALAIDNAGRVWAGTDNGLARYDGTSFMPVANPDLGPKITAIAVDRGGNKWIGSSRGLFLLTWDNHWYAYNQRDDFRTGSRLLSDNIVSIATAPRDAAGDDIYVATDRGLNAVHCMFSDNSIASQAVVAPNPFMPGSGSQVMLSRLPDRATVRIYTVDGRLVAKAAGPAAPAHQLFLRLGAELPKDLASGIYLICITTAAGPAGTLKLVLLR